MIKVDILTAMRWGAENPRRIFEGIFEEHTKNHDIYNKRLFGFNWFNNHLCLFQYNNEYEPHVYPSTITSYMLELDYYIPEK